MSTVPIIRQLKDEQKQPKKKPLIQDLSCPQDVSSYEASESSESDSKNIYMEFSSSSSDEDQSLTTKSSKRPLIVDLSEEETKEGNSGASEADRRKLKEANLKRR
jgi:hypothetical protein